MTKHRRLFVVAAVVGAAVAATATGSVATTGDGKTAGQNVIREQLSGFEETPLAVSTAASGRFSAVINDKAQEVSWRLSYADLSAPVTQAHVHFGSPGQTGGISVFLCTNAGNGPAGTQACPAAPATVTGTIKPGDIIGPGGQGLAAGEFAELVRAIRAGFTYINVHSTAFPIGEVRGQIDHGHH